MHGPLIYRCTIPFHISLPHLEGLWDSLHSPGRNFWDTFLGGPHTVFLGGICLSLSRSAVLSGNALLGLEYLSLPAGRASSSSGVHCTTSCLGSLLCTLLCTLWEVSLHSLCHSFFATRTALTLTLEALHLSCTAPSFCLLLSCTLTSNTGNHWRSALEEALHTLSDGCFTI